jgi:hypothetical protein
MRRLDHIVPFLILTLAASTACEETMGPGTDQEVEDVLNNTYAQTDRFGLPAIATVFIPANRKDSYNEAAPVNDATYRSDVVSTLVAFGNSEAAANGLADALLPDVQPINTAMATAFLNGRRPQDDVITAELGLIFGDNAALNDDHVDANDVAFPGTFPYLAAPHLP